MNHEYKKPIILTEKIESFFGGITPLAVCWGNSTSQGNASHQEKCK